MRNLYLHIGLPKTGTSYLQGWLETNRNALAEAGTWIPARPICAHRLAAEFITDISRAARADVVRIKATPYEFAQNDVTAGLNDPRFLSGIVSSEYFFECQPTRLEPLCRLMGDTQVFIVIFLRRQDRIIESGYNQEVKSMGVSAILGPPAYREKLNWLKLFENWSGVFGTRNLRVVNYDEVVQSGELLAEFLKACNLPESLLRTTCLDIADSENKSLPASLLEFKRLANAFGEFGLDEWLARAVEAGLSGPPFRLAPDIARQHLAFYADSNRELARRLGGTHASDLFPIADLDERSAAADFTSRLPTETAAQVLALFMRQAEERQAALSNRIAELERRIELLAHKKIDFAVRS